MRVFSFSDSAKNVLISEARIEMSGINPQIQGDKTKPGV
jgi:hypothetical protein